MFTTRFLRSALLLAAAAAPCVFAAPAFALSPTTYVSATGTDAGACATAASACRTFNYAHGQTIPGGVMEALTAGDFGRLHITKTMTVIGVPGAMAKPVGPYSAITIDAPLATVEIIGLDLDGSGNPMVSPIGVFVYFAGKVTIKNCNIHNFLADGIAFRDSTKFLIENTNLSNLGGAGVSLKAPYPAVAVGALQGVSVNGAADAGLAVAYNNRASVTDTLVVNSAYGYTVTGQAKLEIARSSAVHNKNFGLYKDATSTVESAGNNFFRDNGVANVAGTISMVGGQ